VSIYCDINTLRVVERNLRGTRGVALQKKNVKADEINASGKIQILLSQWYTTFIFDGRSRRNENVNSLFYMSYQI
jgi:hypothetical protein